MSNEQTKRAYAEALGERMRREAEAAYQTERRSSRRRSIGAMVGCAIAFAVAGYTLDKQFELPFNPTAWITIAGVLFGYYIERSLFGRP